MRSNKFAEGRALPASTLNVVLNQVSLETGVSRQELLGERRTDEIAQARHLAMWRLRQIKTGGYADYSFPEIGRAFNRDHTSVMAGVERVEKRMAEAAQERAA